MTVANAKKNAPPPGTSAPMELDGEAMENARVAREEGFEQKSAFEEYWKLGAARSLVKVAEKVGRHITTIEKWSSAFRWGARVRERESYQIEYEKSAKAAVADAESHEKVRRLVGLAIAKWFQEFQDGRIKFRGVEDLEKLLMIQARLNAPTKGAGAPASVHQHLHLHQGGAGNSPMGAVDLGLRGKSREDLLATMSKLLRGIERVSGQAVLEAAPPKPAKTAVPAKKYEEPIDVEGVELPDLDID